jgi:hypothetical protein
MSTSPPLYVVRNAATRWLTTVNYDLFIYADRLVSVQGLTVAGAMARHRQQAAERRRSKLPAPPLSQSRAAQVAWAEQRVSEAMGRTDAQLLARARGNRVVRWAEVSRGASETTRRSVPA